MKNGVSSFLGLLSSLILILPSQQAIAQNRMVRIGVVIDGPWERNDDIREMTQREILTLTEGEFDVRFPDSKIITAEWTLAGVKSAIDRLFADPEVDLVLTMGVLASGNVSRRANLPKPVVAPFTIDAELQGLPAKDGGTGVKNLHYLSLPSPVVRDIRMFREIVTFNEVTILLNSVVQQEVPELQVRITEALKEMGVIPTIVGVERTIDSALNALTPETQAVYICPLLHLQPGHFQRLIDSLIERKIPSFSLMGVSEVEQGVMATLSPDLFPRLTRRIALNIQRILLGDDPSTLPTSFAVGERLTINMATARAIGVSPPFSVLTEAVLINEERETVERRLKLSKVLQEAIDKNLDLAAEGHFVSANKQNINIARSNLLPQIDLSATGLLIDDDRAAASLGSQPERTLRAGGTLTQLIFSESAWANLSIQKNLQQSRVEELEQLRQDIAQDAATTYLNLLRAKTFERVQKENLKRTRENFELAKVRQEIGYSRRAEVYRWESQIANDRQEVITANSQRNLAEIALNRLLHQPLEEPFLTEEADLGDPALSMSQEGMEGYFDDPASFKTLRAFLAEEGIVSSPEMRAIDAVIAAKQRELLSNSLAFWVPSVALQAEFSRLLKEGGAGTAGLQLPPSIPITFPEADNSDWSVALNISIPLSEGGNQIAQRSRASQELQELHLRRQGLAELVEQRIRSALHVAGASHAGIGLRRSAADAAKKNLDLVTDAYSRGAVDILALLDAQNSALTAELAAANAVYDFLIDLVEAERSVGQLYFFDTTGERAAFMTRLRDYFNKAGVSPRGR